MQVGFSTVGIGMHGRFERMEQVRQRQRGRGGNGFDGGMMYLADGG